MSPPRFLYFDLGNVLLFFDHRLACRQMGALAGVAEETVWQIVFESDLEMRYEAGDIDDREFYEIFCRETGTRPDFRGAAAGRQRDLHAQYLDLASGGRPATPPAIDWASCRTPVRPIGPIAPTGATGC